MWLQWLHRSKLKHMGEALDNHAKELIIDGEIIEKQKQDQDTLTYRYNPFFGTYFIYDHEKDR